MNTLMAAAIRCSLMFLVPVGAYAISAQWDLDPISGDWNTAANWTPDGVPNGPADIATFGLSNTTDVSISADTEVNGITFTTAATNPYFITVSSGVTLTLSGTGITNNSGIAQDLFSGGQILFTNSASAGNAGIDSYGLLQFSNNSTAGSANIGNGGFTVFSNAATAGSANIVNYSGGGMVFSDSSTAGSANFLNYDANFMDFYNTSTAGNATILSAGFISFYDSSRGGTARIGVFSVPFREGGILDISGHNAPGITIGSLEGNEFGTVFLGANDLTVGSNNLSTTFSGVIQDNFGGPPLGGSLSKIGTGTLILSGANTYTGSTNVNRGVLQVDGSITSNTFVNHRSTLAGTGTINGNATNNDFGTVRPGGALGTPGMLTIAGNYTQTQYATLMIQIAGMSPDQFSVLNVLGNANLNGVLDPVLLNGFVPSIGDSFVFLNYASLTGGFSRIRNQVFDDGMLQWSVTYQNTYAILTVGPNTIPDHGSTFLLLTLGLLGLVTYRRRLIRK